MRLTIIPSDGFVSVDGEGYSGIDLSFMPADIHAVQWYDTEGEIEYRDSRGRATRNETIEDVAVFQPAVVAWQSAKDAVEQAHIEAMEQMALAEAAAQPQQVGTP